MFNNLTTQQIHNYKVTASKVSYTSEHQEALSTLARASIVDIRTSVASNPSCPYKVLLILGADEDWRVRNAVVRNSTATKALLSKMLKVEAVNLIIGNLQERLGKLK